MSKRSILVCDRCGLEEPQPIESVAEKERISNRVAWHGLWFRRGESGAASHDADGFDLCESCNTAFKGFMQGRTVGGTSTSREPQDKGWYAHTKTPVEVHVGDPCPVCNIKDVTMEVMGTGTWLQCSRCQAKCEDGDTMQIGVPYIVLGPS